MLLHVYWTNVSCVVSEMVIMSPRSSVCSSACSSFHGDDVDDCRKSSSSTPECRPNDHPLNLTKQKDQRCVTGSPEERDRCPSHVALEPTACSGVGPADRLSPAKPSPSTFSLKTSPSKFLSSPADDQRRAGSTATRPVDSWSQLPVGRKAVRPMQPAYDTNPAPMMLSTSPSALDRVSCSQQEAQLSQRGRAVLYVIEYFAISHSKSLKVIRSDTPE